MKARPKVTGARIHSEEKTDKKRKPLTKLDPVGQTTKWEEKTKDHEQTRAGIYKETHTPWRSQQYSPNGRESKPKRVEFVIAICLLLRHQDSLRTKRVHSSYCAKTCREREQKPFFPLVPALAPPDWLEQKRLLRRLTIGRRKKRDVFSFPPSLARKFSTRERHLDSRQVLEGCTEVEKGLPHRVPQHNTDRDQ